MTRNIRDMLDIRDAIQQMDVHVQRYPIPGTRGLVTKFLDGYLILISDHVEGRLLERTLAHELLHIKLGHLDDRRDLPEDVKENEVREALKAMGY